MRTREELERLLDRLSEADLEAEYRRLREAVDGEPQMAPLPAGWGQTLTGERMPNVVAAVPALARLALSAGLRKRAGQPLG